MPPGKLIAARETSTRARTKVTVKPVANAIQILRYLGRSGTRLRSVDIARHLSINKSTCFNILRTLADQNVIDFDAVSRTYTVGLGLADLLENTLAEGHRIAVARPVMQQLASQYSVAVSLWRLMGQDRIVMIAIEHSPANIRIHLNEGQRLPLFTGATGRIMAGHLGLSKAQMRTAFKAVRWQTPLTFEDYCSQVEWSRERGFAIDDGNFTRGTMSLSAPIFDAAGAVAFCLAVVMFQGQYDAQTVMEIGDIVVKETRLLSAMLTPKAAPAATQHA